MLISEKQTLKLDPDTRTETEIEIDRARIQGFHEAIKSTIEHIKDIENIYLINGYEISKEFINLRNRLGLFVYKD